MLRRTRVGAYALIMHGSELLLTELADGPDKGSWGLPGGGIEHGEAPLAALLREVHEETGLALDGATIFTTVSRLRRWRRPSGEDEEVHYVGIIYRVALAQRAPLREGGDGGSCAAARWFDPAELATLPLGAPARAVLAEAGLVRADQAGA